ncbi:MAG: hypothetical protein GY854_15735 [Deltaproteobacteria bacterium]|nr:hypothetical protein [Deltaproteobacteria bacterium]
MFSIIIVAALLAPLAISFVWITIQWDDWVRPLTIYFWSLLLASMLTVRSYTRRNPTRSHAVRLNLVFVLSLGGGVVLAYLLSPLNPTLLIIFSILIWVTYRMGLKAAAGAEIVVSSRTAGHKPGASLDRRQTLGFIDRKKPRARFLFRSVLWPSKYFIAFVLLLPSVFWVFFQGLTIFFIPGESGRELLTDLLLFIPVLLATLYFLAKTRRLLASPFGIASKRHLLLVVCGPGICMFTLLITSYWLGWQYKDFNLGVIDDSTRPRWFLSQLAIPEDNCNNYSINQQIDDLKSRESKKNQQLVDAKTKVETLQHSNMENRSESDILGLSSAKHWLEVYQENYDYDRREKLLSIVPSEEYARRQLSTSLFNAYGLIVEATRLSVLPLNGAEWAMSAASYSEEIRSAWFKKKILHNLFLLLVFVTTMAIFLPGRTAIPWLSRRFDGFKKKLGPNLGSVMLIMYWLLYFLTPLRYAFEYEIIRDPWPELSVSRQGQVLHFLLEHFWVLFGVGIFVVALVLVRNIRAFRYSEHLTEAGVWWIAPNSPLARWKKKRAGV